MAVNWSRLPAELRERRQWLVSPGTYTEKRPMSVSPSGDLYFASSTEPLDWLTFEDALDLATEYNYHIGYVLSEDDDFSCIDFDVCDGETQKAKSEPHNPELWTTPEQFNWFWGIVQHVDSYTELSRSRKGLHIWVRAKIGKGIKKQSVEIYSEARFIICTGEPVLDRPLRECQQWLEQVADYLRGQSQASNIVLKELEQSDTDQIILERAWNAENAAKFQALWKGDWRALNYPSQSEADISLMSMLTFYSKSNEQCRRIFRMSGLGQRKKAVKNNVYLDRTLRLIRKREEHEAERDDRAAAGARELIASMNAKAQQQPTPPLHVPGLPTPAVQPPPISVAVALAGPVAAPVAEAAKDGLPWPPGFIGALAGFIYESSPRPVKEVSIIAALGLMAGICGKAFFIPGSGLNLYLILVARSAVGKEAMHSGISGLISAAASRMPGSLLFTDFSDFASGPALVKACAANQSFVNIAGEIGHKLKRFAQEDGRDAAAASLRMVMTNLYQKSGPQSIVGGITYSNKDANIASVSGVAFSIIGETTPRRFYESLTQSMMEDGFLSRFTMIEYDGERPPLNESPIRVPSQALGDALAQLCVIAAQNNGQGKTTGVGRTNEAAVVMRDFEKECDVQINSTKEESWRQMWNRASLKVMRIAALLAVGDNWVYPMIELHHVTWALDLIRRDILVMRRRIDNGDVGTDDYSRERKLLAVLREYVANGASEGYKVPKEMHKNGIVPHKLFQIRCSRLTTFSNHRLGAKNSLDNAVRGLIDSGYIMDVAKDKVADGFNFHGKCYRILNLPDNELERMTA